MIVALPGLFSYLFYARTATEELPWLVEKNPGEGVRDAGGGGGQGSGGGGRRSLKPV